MFKKLAQSPFLTTSALAVIGFNLSNFVHFLANFFLVKALTVELYGEYTATTAYSALISLPLTIILLILIKIFGSKRAGERQTYLFVFERRLKKTLARWSPALILAGGIFIWWLKNFSNLTNIFSLVYIIAAFIISVLTTLYTGFLQGNRKFTQYYLANILAALLKFTGYVVIFWWQLGLETAYIFLIASGILSLAYQRYQAYRHFHPPTATKQVPVMPFTVGRFVRRRDVWLPAITMAGLITFINGDLIIIKKFATGEQAGLYGVISLFAKMISYALQPIAEVVFSFAAARETKHQQRQNLYLTTIFFIFAGAAATGAYAWLGPFLITIFAKDSYLEVASYLPLAAVFGTLYMLNTLYGKHLIAQNRLAGGWSLIFCASQIAALIIWHQNFWQVLTINIAISAVLFIFYLSLTLKKDRLTAKPG
jgi:O-antigen/teichoic acid export membrane protein